MKKTVEMPEEDFMAENGANTLDETEVIEAEVIEKTETVAESERITETEIAVIQEETTVQTAKQETPVKQIIPVKKLKSFEQCFREAQVLAGATIVPRDYQANPSNCLIAVEIADRMGLNPLMVMQNMYVIQGRPTFSGQFCTAIIKNKYHGNAYPVYTGSRNDDTWGCYFMATDSSGTEIKGTEVTIAMAKKEGWYSKKDRYGNETSKWQSFPEQMLAYRAAAFFARVHCPNELMGFSVEGEPEDIAVNQGYRRTTQPEFVCCDCGKPFRDTMMRKNDGTEEMKSAEWVYNFSRAHNADGQARCGECMKSKQRKASKEMR